MIDHPLYLSDICTSFYFLSICVILIHINNNNLELKLVIKIVIKVIFRVCNNLRLIRKILKMIKIE